MKKLLVLGSVLCGVLVMASPAAAHNWGSSKPSLTCTSIVTNVSVRSVNVPAGASCTLVDSIVRDDVRVREGSYFQATNTDIGGSVRSRDSQTVFVEAGSGVGDSIVTQNTAQVFVFGSFIGDEIDVYGASDITNICGNRVRWDIEVTASQQDILVGDPLAVDCAGNRVLKGDIEVERNNTDVELVVAGNRIVQGDLEVLRNRGTSDKRVSDNRGGDEIECHQNDAPFVALNNTDFNDADGQCA
jgi:hypothetical protein